MKKSKNRNKVKLGVQWFCVALLYCCAISLSAQSAQLGFSIGGSNYFGDLDFPNEINNLKNTDVSFGLFYRQEFTDRLSLRGNIAIVNINADDTKVIPNELDPATIIQINRNLNFQNTILEFSGLVEFKFLKAGGIDLFVVGGIGVFKHSPKALFNGNLISLQELGTEGQGLPGFPAPYSLTQFSVPVGGGIYKNISDRFAIQIEVLGRVTFTDYLDDVSTQYVNQLELGDFGGPLTVELADPWIGPLAEKPSLDPTGSRVRGNPNLNDYFFTTTVSGIYKFGAGGSSDFGCPNF